MNARQQHQSDPASAEINQTLLADQQIAADGDAIESTLDRGVATLRVNVTTVESKQRSEVLAKRVRGVQVVRNDLSTDNEVVAAVRRAVGRDPEISGADITVTAFNGNVTLAGAVGDTARRSAIGACAAAVPSARSVENQIWAPGDDGRGKARREILPTIGAAIFAPDGFVGNVEYVILSPSNYYVVATVVRTTLCRDARFDDGLRLDPPPIRERHLVLPVDAIEDALPSGVFLGITCRAAAQCDDFDRQSVTVPPETWPPPPPYEHADVFFGLRQISRHDK